MRTSEQFLLLVCEGRAESAAANSRPDLNLDHFDASFNEAENRADEATPEVL